MRGVGRMQGSGVPAVNLARQSNRRNVLSHGLEGDDSSMARALAGGTNWDPPPSTTLQRRQTHGVRGRASGPGDARTTPPRAARPARFLGRAQTTPRAIGKRLDPSNRSAKVHGLLLSEQSQLANRSAHVRPNTNEDESLGWYLAEKVGVGGDQNPAKLARPLSLLRIKDPANALFSRRADVDTPLAGPTKNTCIDGLISVEPSRHEPPLAGGAGRRVRKLLSELGDQHLIFVPFVSNKNRMVVEVSESSLDLGERQMGVGRVDIFERPAQNLVLVSQLAHFDATARDPRPGAGVVDEQMLASEFHNAPKIARSRVKAERHGVPSNGNRGPSEHRRRDWFGIANTNFIQPTEGITKK